MNKEHFWMLIEKAREHVPDTRDGSNVADCASALLARRSVHEITAAQQTLWDLMADSYQNRLWAAAYVINGGCSDDGFDYFRGWLIAQGRPTFERVLAAPDTLAELSHVRTAAAEGTDLDCEDMLSIVWNAHQKATGQELPAGAFTIRYPDLDPAWDFNFDDREEMARRLPALTALYSY
ncbi:DUF4240 domain-containing protein [Streptomyces sp. ASQP_92]|uniref:DUF4240 domain-containing protein n=1 Tax=Streptomyces sp. ASQP_92 TaxID=2979116 RepID=UPI0021C1BA97|nr:DUF4240 domain-containing protein [Streptomyces sp. ASQP_92]MCT9094246.1 DUF4240 domain-containing protein [Streptomyces sp. ASQP_92]